MTGSTDMDATFFDRHISRRGVQPFTDLNGPTPGAGYTGRGGTWSHIVNPDPPRLKSCHLRTSAGVVGAWFNDDSELAASRKLNPHLGTIHAPLLNLRLVQRMA
jgi:hypothetical protein